jgi:hypothetical protein
VQPTLTNQFGDSSGEPTRHWQPYCGEATLRPAPPSVPRHMCVRVGSWPSKLMRCGWGCAGGAVCTRRGQNRVQGGQRVWLYDSVGCSHVRSFLAVREHWHVAACVLTATAGCLPHRTWGFYCDSVQNVASQKKKLTPYHPNALRNRPSSSFSNARVPRCSPHRNSSQVCVCVYPLTSKVRYLYSKKFSIEMGLRGVTTHPQPS